MKISACCEHPHGACSYYRTMGVLPRLNRIDKDIVVEQVDQLDWFLMADSDIVYMERPQSPAFKKAAHLVKDYGVKLWIDYDDNLFQLPDYNPYKSFYDSKPTRDIIIDCLSIADVVTVATDSIKEEYGKYNDNVVVVPNAFNDYNYSLTTTPSQNKIIQWRGSRTHRDDLRSCGDEMVEVAKNNPSWGWSFIGEDLWYITESIPANKCQKEMPNIQYWKYIKSVNPAIQIVPLVFNTFNEGKSNIAWIEATYAGAVAVAPGMPEWIKPGVVNYETPKQFRDQLDSVINDSGFRKQQFDLSVKYIRENLLLSHVNKQRVKVVKSLVGALV